MNSEVSDVALTKQQLDTAEEAIRKLAETDGENLSTRKAVKRLQPIIDKATQRGHSLESIGAILRQNGIDITQTTLKAYLRDSRRPARKRSRQEEAQQGDAQHLKHHPVGEKTPL